VNKIYKFHGFYLVMKRKKYLSWESYFMSIAVLSSFRSKDSKTNNGAVIVDSDKKVIGVGYNGLPKGFDDNKKIFWSDDDSSAKNSKHSYVVHAEANAIYNRNTSRVSGQVMYCTLFPCRECAKAIIQNNICEVIYLTHKEHHKEVNDVVKLLFKEAGVKLKDFSNLKIKDKKFIENLVEFGKSEY
jgi:dCMP deaminase